jgi:hypothetical protein
MSGQWISYWIQNIYNTSITPDPLITDLHHAYTNKNTMLAAVIRVNIWTGNFRISMQGYTPPETIGGWKGA